MSTRGKQKQEQGDAAAPVKAKRKGPTKWPPARLGMLFGGLAAAAGTGTMNIRAWAAQATTDSERYMNIAIGGSMEMIGIAGLAYAGHQVSKK
ncbi:MAG: hypothetical protein AAFR68_18475, partial [Pseudomonadota bacterium]